MSARRGPVSLEDRNERMRERGDGAQREGGKNHRQQRPRQPCLIRSAGSAPRFKDVGSLSTCPTYHCVTRSHHRLPFIIWCCISHKKAPSLSLLKCREDLFFLLKSPFFSCHLLPLSLTAFLPPFISSLFIPPLPVLSSLIFSPPTHTGGQRPHQSNLTPPAMTNGHLKRPTCHAVGTANGSVETDEGKI